MTENSNLSQREIEILSLVAKGASNKEIARDLHISANTVKVHLRNIFTKIDANSRTEAAMHAVNLGIVAVGAKGVESNSVAETQLNNRNILIGVGVFSLILVAGLFAVLIWQRIFAQNPSSSTPLEGFAIQRWQERAPMPTARKGFASAVHGSTIFAIAGDTDQGVTGVVESYSTETDEWGNLSPKQVPVSDVGAVVIGGNIFVPGGRLQSGEVTDVLEIYNLQDMVWEFGMNLPQPVSGYAIAGFEGKLYLFGGWNGSDVINNVYEYDPDRDEWLERKPMPTARAYAGAAVAFEKIYVLGGTDGNQVLDNNEYFHPELDDSEDEIWIEGLPLPEVRSEISAVNIADKIYVIGGKGEAGDDSKWYTYLPTTDEWISFSDKPSTIGSRNGLVTSGDYIYSIGGDVNSSRVDNTVVYQAIYSISIPVITK